MIVCPSCGQENPDGFRFCGACATPLGDATAAREERKVVTALFCDLVGSTEQGERLDPEDLQALLSRYHLEVRTELERFGATVEKFIGDAVVAFFGAPVSHEDDPERAVRAALAVRDWALQQPDLHVRIAVTTGEALVVLGARTAQGEHLASGDVLNTAARLQAVAPVDGVLVGEQTYRATERSIEYRQHDAVEVKGKSQPVAVWEALRARSRFGVDVQQAPRTALIGRELEKTLLTGIFDRTVQQRSVQRVTLVGEPGVGKSRLVAELLAHLDAKSGLVRWRQGRCLPYGEGITFWALGEIVKGEAGILESDSAETATEKLDRAVSLVEPDRPWLIQRLLPLVGVEAASPAARQELFTAWRRFFESLAAASPTVLVFEDLHWADEALLAFLEYLAEWSDGVPLLMVCTARPELYERRAEWGAGLRNVHVINLSPLSDQETAELVSQLTSTAIVGTNAARAIVDRAGGNPLYAEEFVRLLAQGSISADATLPDTVQALIAARLDTLTPDRKGLVQDAAVLGKVFWAGALAEMGGRAEADVELALHELVRKELVRPARQSSIEGETEYSFWHMLVRDVAYSQTPRVDRARRHRAAAAWIEGKAGARVEDLAEVLAHHYLQALELAQAAGDSAQAAELAVPARQFLALAGDRALGLDSAQAEARLARALELTPAEDAGRPALLVRWANAAFQAGRLREAAAAVEDALASFHARGEMEGVALALQLRSRVGMRLGEGYVALAREAVELLERKPPGPALVAAQAQLANAEFIAGHTPQTIAAAESAIAIAERLGLPEPARALSYRGIARVYIGDASGIADMERALALLLDRGATQDAAVVQNNLPLVRYLLEGPARALAAFEQAIAFCRERGLDHAALVCETNCPGLLAELGQTSEALDLAARLASAAQAMGESYDLIELGSVELTIRLASGERVSRAAAEELVRAARESGGIEPVVFAFAAAAAILAVDAPGDACSLLQELEETEGSREPTSYRRELAGMVRTALAAGDRTLAERLAAQFEPRYPIDEHALCAVRAQLSEHAGELGEAASLYGHAATRWQEFGHVLERAHALLGRGRCLVALGKPEAEQPLSQAREVFASVGYRLALAEADTLLARLPTAAS